MFTFAYTRTNADGFIDSQRADGRDLYQKNGQMRKRLGDSVLLLLLIVYIKDLLSLPLMKLEN